jgi:hypothetical protein
MKIDLKVILPYIVIIASLAMTWGMWSERLEAVEKKADAVAQMQQDIAKNNSLVMRIHIKNLWILMLWKQILCNRNNNLQHKTH